MPGILNMLNELAGRTFLSLASGWMMRPLLSLFFSQIAARSAESAFGAKRPMPFAFMRRTDFLPAAVAFFFLRFFFGFLAFFFFFFFFVFFAFFAFFFFGAFLAAFFLGDFFAAFLAAFLAGFFFAATFVIATTSGFLSIFFTGATTIPM